jgi:hypothetical protein
MRTKLSTLQAKTELPRLQHQTLALTVRALFSLVHMRAPACSLVCGSYLAFIRKLPCYLCSRLPYIHWSSLTTLRHFYPCHHLPTMKVSCLPTLYVCLYWHVSPRTCTTLPKQWFELVQLEVDYFNLIVFQKHFLDCFYPFETPKGKSYR